jgi:hypothetical protein
VSEPNPPNCVSWEWKPSRSCDSCWGEWLEMNDRIKTTLFELVWELAEVTRDDREVVAALSHWMCTGRLRIDAQVGPRLGL